MENTTRNTARNTTIGILAHVDAGKTTLSESILYCTGALRTRGRVDHGDAFLDTDAMEKKRGITIYSKLARFRYGDRPFTLLDTPGHADFSPETERALQVLDAAVLVVSAPDLWSRRGSDPQVEVLWKLLRHYEIPTLIFLNKLDQLPSEDAGTVAGQLVQLLAKNLGDGAVLFGRDQLSKENEEAVALCEESLTERVLEGGQVMPEDVRRLVTERKLFPVYAGSALRDEGTVDLLEGILRFASPGGQRDAGASAEEPENLSEDGEEAFGAQVYKITREGGTRLTWMKITDGVLHVRDAVEENCGRGGAGGALPETDAQDAGAETTEEKISELRLYSGERFRPVTAAAAGEIVAAAGLSFTRAGDGLGIRRMAGKELLTPILTCTVTAKDRFGKPVDAFTLMQALRELEEQEPMLQVAREETGEITVRIMGAIQMEILENLLRERYDLRAEFGTGTIVYRETIRRPVEGVGHFEPLRHYAEVHLLLEPGEPESGITFANRCLPNMLERNWQNLILSQLSSGNLKGVLTGAGLTDVKISLLGGRANKKHTSGGDFRKAAFAAVRQGLMMAENILLEPVMKIVLELPAENVGRAMTDIGQMHGSCRPAVFREESAVLEGTVPASELGDYAAVVAGYTGGRGRLTASLAGYEPCHNAREVMEEKGYDPDADAQNPTWSVFCSHGAGTIVPWNRVRDFMHVDCGWQQEPAGEGPFRSEDYYTYTPGAAGEDYDIDLPQREEDTPGQGQGTLGDTKTGNTKTGNNDRSVRRRQPEDYRERERKRQSEEDELRRIFEKTYGPVRQTLRHPDNERTSTWAAGEGLVLPSEETQSGPAQDGGKENGRDTAGAAQQGTGTSERRGTAADGRKRPAEREPMQEFLLVDGYNIVFAWEELKELAAADIKAARDRLLDILSDYAGYSGENVIVVFDAYRVAGGKGEVLRYHNIDVVYTKEAETADLYIEKTAHRLTKRHRVRVATGDFVEQVIIFGSGAVRLSPRGLLEEILFAGRELKERYLS